MVRLFIKTMAACYQIIQRLIVKAIKLYQYVISPFLPYTCRFYPSCSTYCYQAVASYGVIKGLWIGLKRIGRCHPWNKGGYDPISQATEVPTKYESNAPWSK